MDYTYSPQQVKVYKPGESSLTPNDLRVLDTVEDVLGEEQPYTDNGPIIVTLTKGVI